MATYLLMMGATWDSTASQVGCSHQTIANWKHDVYWWEKAKEEAIKRWLYDVTDLARCAVCQQLREGDGDLGLKVLERLDPAFAPATQKVNVQHRITWEEVLQLSDAEILTLLGGTTTNGTAPQ